MGHRIESESAIVLSPVQVARLVGRHKDTVTKALRDGELRGKQRTVGGFWYVRREDALEWAFGEPYPPVDKRTPM